MDMTWAWLACIEKNNLWDIYKIRALGNFLKRKVKSPQPYFQGHFYMPLFSKIREEPIHQKKELHKVYGCFLEVKYVCVNSSLILQCRGYGIM